MKLQETQTESIAAFILVGGASRRMGRDKAQLTLAEDTFVEIIKRTTDAISVVETRLVGARGEQALNRFESVPDVYPDWGALGGLHAALAACEAQWALIVACDMPFVTAELLRFLANLRADEFDAIVPVQADGRSQPLCAYYRAAVAVEAAETLIQAGERALRPLLNKLRTRYIAPVEWQHLPHAPRLLANINAPDDYAKAQQLICEAEK